jgi:hypothetical protein
MTCTEASLMTRPFNFCLIDLPNECLVTSSLQFNRDSYLMIRRFHDVKHCIVEVHYNV